MSVDFKALLDECFVQGDIDAVTECEVLVQKAVHDYAEAKSMAAKNPSRRRKAYALADDIDRDYMNSQPRLRPFKNYIMDECNDILLAAGMGNKKRKRIRGILLQALLYEYELCYK